MLLGVLIFAPGGLGVMLALLVVAWAFAGAVWLLRVALRPVGAVPGRQRDRPGHGQVRPLDLPQSGAVARAARRRAAVAVWVP